MHANALCITTGHQTAARRRAHASGDTKMRELASLSRHPVQCRCAVNLRAKRLNIAIAEVVTEDDDEIWPLVGQATVGAFCSFSIDLHILCPADAASKHECCHEP